MSGALQAVFQNQRSFGTAAGSQSYTTAGTFTWVAPAGVTKVSIVAVGGGGGGRCGGNTYWGGGALAWRNGVSVTPGTSYTVYVGVGGANAAGGYSYACFSSNTMANGGGTGTQGESCFTGQGGGKGGKKGNNAGGGAGGYSGQGGIGGCGGSAGATGAGGAGGGGGGSNSIVTPGVCRRLYFGPGGGVGLYGQGSNGVGGTGGGSTGIGGGGGSSGCAGGTASCVYSPPTGGAYGGAGGSTVISSGPFVCCSWTTTTFRYGAGSSGAYRIVWPGCSRTFPSTCVGSP